MNKPFSNQTIVGPNPKKPHIVKRDGLWRVSPMPKKAWPRTRTLWLKAHRWVNGKNSKIIFNRLRS